MKKTPSPHTGSPKNSTPSLGLEAWLLDDRSDEFLGRAARVKLAVLAELASGNAKHPAAMIARRFGLTRAAVGVHVRSARQIFGFQKPKKRA